MAEGITCGVGDVKLFLVMSACDWNARRKFADEHFELRGGLCITLKDEGQKCGEKKNLML